MCTNHGEGERLDQDMVGQKSITTPKVRVVAPTDRRSMAGGQAKSYFSG